MATPLEGLLAVNKPIGISSAQVIRLMQRVFKESEVFAETLDLQQNQLASENLHQKRRRRKKQCEIKMGHGGTLDPMATGVLVTGIGGGTKQLSQFLLSTKSYEATALFGCATDTFDARGKILRRAPYSHITRQIVETALDAFRGDIMQTPPIYSALSLGGKRLYEYAREGKELPAPIEPRPARTESIELVDFTTEHDYEFPSEEATEEEKIVGEAIEKGIAASGSAPEQLIQPEETSTQRKHPRSETPPEPAANKRTKSRSRSPGEDTIAASSDIPSKQKPAAITIRMTVTSGFYVRSLVEDLGKALGSAAHMVKLVRTRQGDYELGKNVIEWEDLMAEDKSVWEGRVVEVLKAWGDENPPKGGTRGAKKLRQRVSREERRKNSSSPEAENEKGVREEEGSKEDKEDKDEGETKKEV